MLAAIKIIICFAAAFKEPSLRFAIINAEKRETIVIQNLEKVINVASETRLSGSIVKNPPELAASFSANDLNMKRRLRESA